MRKERDTIESRDHEESKGGVENNPGETVIQDPGRGAVHVCTIQTMLSCIAYMSTYL